MGSSSRAALARSLRSWRRPLSSYSAVYSSVNERCHMDALKKFEWRGNKDRVNPEFKDWAPVLSFAAAGLIIWYSTSSMEETISMCLQETKDDQMEVQSDSKKPKVVFVLGGPGSGKGTQCGKIVDTYGFTHLSAGDLLRAEINSGSKDGIMIQNMIKDGKIVPSEVTVKLLQKAMHESNNNKFLIDGFPRNEENRAAFESITGIEPEMVIFFDCPEQEMGKRLLNRNQGRIDDNVETIRKRFKVFVESTLPVVQQYEYRGKVHKINAARPIDEVFENVKPLFVPFVKEDLLQATKDIIKAIDSGDYGRYKQLCDSALTAFEPEAQGHIIEGLAFHKLYMDQCKEGLTFTQSGISCPHITLLDDNVGLVAYTRVYQKISHRGVKVETTNETRVWQRKKIETGKYVWKLVHFHRSKNPSSHSS